MKKYGVCRISTNKQNIERQVRNILAVYSDAIIVREVYTGTKIQGRTKFEELIKIVKSGDNVTVYVIVNRLKLIKMIRG